jgi:hypothetical protein
MNAAVVPNVKILCDGTVVAVGVIDPRVEFTNSKVSSMVYMLKLYSTRNKAVPERTLSKHGLCEDEREVHFEVRQCGIQMETF